MAVTATIDCSTVSGSAAPWVAEVYVYIDGTLVGDESHQPTDDGPWWSWSVSVDLAGDHTVRVTDRPAAGGEYFVAETELSCAPPVTEPSTTIAAPPVPATAATTSPATTTTPATTDTVVSLASVDRGAPTTVVTTAPAQVLAETLNTLPATGSSVSGIAGAGSGLLLCGALLLAVARRRPMVADRRR